MIPEAAQDLTTLEETVYPSTTYKLDLSAGRIWGKIDGEEAALQAVTKLILTERYANVIYSGAYGSELQSLIGKDYEYVRAEMSRRIQDALLVDDRILSVAVSNISSQTQDQLVVDILVETVDGSFSISTEVSI